MANMTLNTFIQRFNAGDFEAGDFDIQVEAGWYDWFCLDSSLANKTKKLGKKVRQISESPKFDSDKVYVFFKNNCPMWSGLYDDFRICDMETGNVLFTVIPACSAYDNKNIVFGRDNNFKESLVEGSWSDVKKFFMGK